MATLQRDGFAGYQGGTVLTAPIRISGSTIRVSVDGGSGDGVRVGIYGDNVHSVENCDPIKGKQTDVTVTWKGSSALKLVNGGVSLVFQIPADATAFAFRA